MLKDAVDSYLAIRRAGGFKLENDEWYLNSFARFATAQGETHVIAQTAIAWAAQTHSESQRAQRLKALIRFARFSHAADGRHEIPPSGVFCSHMQRPTPYLFTNAEIERLMDQATQLGPAGSLRPYTYRTLIGLLAATGLRVSEAIGLCCQDLSIDGLLIRETKFRKSRLVPLHATTRAALDRYLAKRCQVATSDDHLLISCRRRALTRCAVHKTFRQLTTAAGLPRQPGQAPPRLMDFRHSFASNALLSCPEGRDHTGRHTLALMTYLGHVHPSSTYWYLEHSAPLMSDIAQACETWIEENTP